MRKPYVKDLRVLDGQLKGLLDDEIVDRSEVGVLQDRINSFSDSYTDEDLGEHAYKLYEIQAYALFLKDDIKNAEKFLSDAISLRGRNYYEASVLSRFIEDKKIYIQKYVVNQVKHHGKVEILKGLAWFIVATIITSVSYAWAGSRAESSADGESSYYVFWGAMLFGLYTLGRGIYLYASSYAKAKQILDRL
ncbi:hypothetical protein KC878_02735 [Candidatus Saccharibacteria bacterium]|nr:hypothetical protein [Candidatus Saccharibacteria bacterium]MCB9821276.1 hypothetical protein [Candidatus Nomurabacteria bacterium]